MKEKFTLTGDRISFDGNRIRNINDVDIIYLGYSNHIKDEPAIVVCEKGSESLYSPLKESDDPIDALGAMLTKNGFSNFAQVENALINLDHIYSLELITAQSNSLCSFFVNFKNGTNFEFCSNTDYETATSYYNNLALQYNKYNNAEQNYMIMPEENLEE